MSDLKIGTAVPMPDDARRPVIPEAARTIQDLGFESLWVPDLIIGDGTPSLEATLLLAAAAAATDRINLGFGVLTVPLRPTAWLATQITTLQALSGGRILLGVGSGGFPDSPFWQAMQVTRRGRGARTDEALRALPGLLAGEPTELVPDAPPLTLGPAVPMPPILVGGNSAPAMRRAVEFGGWFPSLIAPDDLRPAVARLRELADEQGVPAPSVTVGGHLILGADEPARAAEESFVRDLVHTHGTSPETAAKVPMKAASPAELAEVFAAYEAAGADRIVTTPRNGDHRTGLETMIEARTLLT